MLRFVTRTAIRRPVLVIAVWVAIVGAGFSVGAGLPGPLPSLDGIRLATHFPDGNAPDPVVVLAADRADSPATTQFRDRLAAVPGVTGVDIQAVTGDLTVLRAGTTDDPSSRTAGTTVRTIRDLQAPFRVEVTGDAARLVDYRAMLGDRIPWAVAVVVLATLLLLFSFTGSVLLPVKAVLTNLLSIGAALGVVVWVFQQGHLAGLFGSVRLDSTNLTVPVLVAAIAFGLSADYEVFLLSRIRETYLRGVGPRSAVAEGIQRTGRIITAAALLMAVVFGGFLAAGSAPIKQIGLGLVLAVALDATVTRMLLVPATMTLLDRLNWWAPAPLRRLHGRIAISEHEPAGRADQPPPEPVAAEA